MSVKRISGKSSRKREDHRLKTCYRPPKQWYTYLPMVTWCLREVPNETAGVNDGIFTQRTFSHNDIVTFLNSVGV